ncbi:DUF3164 family protein [Colwellia psychrerythraea]|jgi:uncharacterized protein DUF3164|uniref:DUF3164 domain-containing protein n=1 Tax=Colwellia psychrerythraea TaxID=28229 RepID=A0A099KN33_COLPS|nr:DUF3164 family protein [Colwellia psychrerythraea]KGJ92149.1 Protein of unknown function DUF3164 [Colwellia psychrerythraea]
MKEVKKEETMLAPKGFVFNAQGDLIKESNLTPLQREEDKLCKALFPMAKSLHDQMAEFKYQSMHLVDTVIERCVKEHNIIKLKKIKGTVTFLSIDGLLKVVRSIDDRIEINSNIEAARQLFDQYRDVIKRDASGDAQQWINTSFETKNGKMSTGKLIEIMNKEIDHPIYKKGVEALRKSLFVAGTKAYLRFYFRESADDEWQSLPLQFSSIEAVNPDEEDANEEVQKAAEEKIEATA